MRLSTLHILEKRFPPEDARALAEAIEEEVGMTRFVTDESLKLSLGATEDKFMQRLALTEAKLMQALAEIKADLMRWVLVTVFGQSAVLLGAAYFFLSHLAK